MAEPTPMGWKFSDLYGELVSRFGLSAADAKTTANLAYMRFLSAFPWSFACPTTTIATAADTKVTALPAAYGELIEPFAYAEEVGYRFDKSPLVSTRQILDWQAESGDTSYPIKYAIEPVDYNIANAQTWQVRWFPTPDAAYTLTYRYRRVPQTLSADGDYPMGGGQHSLTILDFACAEHERRKGDTKGVYSAQAKDSLAQSIRVDRQYTDGTNLGQLTGNRGYGREFISFGYLTDET